MSKSAKNAGVAGVVAQLARGDGWRLPWCERRSLVDESVKVEEGERRREREKNRKKENKSKNLVYEKFGFGFSQNGR